MRGHVLNLVQTAGVYPAEPFNGMQITYSISGAFISKVTDTPGFTTRRALEGALGNGALRVTGKATMTGGFGADVIVTVQASGEAKTFRKYIKAGESTDFDLTAPIGAATQKGSVRISMMGSYNVGTRGLEVSAFLGTKKPDVVDTKPTSPPLSANARLNAILNRYLSEIPKGYTGLGGNLTNIASSIPFTSRFDNWVCGAYQARVLALLDSIKWSPDPKIRALLDGFDYGPVEAPGMLWTLFPHQAVVIYPKGSDWITDGIVLDPWMTQTPKSYTTAEWAQIHSYGSYWGIRGSSAYDGKPEYPTVGGNYVNPSQRSLTDDERKWVSELPQVDKEKLKSVQDPNLRTLLIRNGFKQRKLTGVAIVNCPVNVALVDSAGKTVGYTERGYVGEIGGATVERIQKAPGDWWSLVRFDPTKRLQLRLSATSSGPVEVIIAHGMDRDERTASRYTARVATGERLETDTARPRATLSGAGKSYVPSTLRENSTPSSNPVPAPAPEVALYDNNNIGGVLNGPTGTLWLTFPQAVNVTRIETYHWNGGRGAAPGKITLVEKSSGKTYGPWSATGSSGQGGALNVYWRVQPNTVIPAGTYKVIVSSPQTWSHNPESKNCGFVRLWGRAPGR